MRYRYRECNISTVTINDLDSSLKLALNKIVTPVPNIALLSKILQYLKLYRTPPWNSVQYSLFAFNIAILKVISHSASDIERSTTLVVQYLSASSLITPRVLYRTATIDIAPCLEYLCAIAILFNCSFVYCDISTVALSHYSIHYCDIATASAIFVL